MSLLESRKQIKEEIKDFFEFDIHEKFLVSGIGIVISGVIKSGMAKPNQVALLGPDKNKSFKSVTLKTIHLNRVLSDVAVAGQFACFSIKPTKNTDKLTKEEIRRGMILIDPGAKPEPIWEFEADIVILHHSTTIKEGYQCVMHCGVVRQSIAFKKLNVEFLRIGDKGHALMRFMYNPEFLKKGENILLREGRTKIFGHITKLVYEEQGNEKNSHIFQEKVSGKEEKFSFIRNENNANSQESTKKNVNGKDEEEKHN